MPVPNAEKGDFNKIVRNVLLLMEDWEDFEDLRKKYNAKGRKLDKDQRLAIRAEIDRLVGKLYGLDTEDLGYVMDKFHHTNPEVEKELRMLEEMILDGY